MLTDTPVGVIPKVERVRDVRVSVNFKAAISANVPIHGEPARQRLLTPRMTPPWTFYFESQYDADIACLQSNLMIVHMSLLHSQRGSEMTRFGGQDLELLMPRFF